MHVHDSTILRNAALRNAMCDIPGPCSVNCQPNGLRCGTYKPCSLFLHTTTQTAPTKQHTTHSQRYKLAAVQATDRNTHNASNTERFANPCPAALSYHMLRSAPDYRSIVFDQRLIVLGARAGGHTMQPVQTGHPLHAYSVAGP